METQTKMTSMVNSARWIPSYMTEKHENLELGIEVFWCEEILTMIAYSGRGKNHIMYSKFRTFDQMETSIINLVTNIMNDAKRKEEEKQKQKQLKAEFNIHDHYKVGEVIVNSWGYEQTNIEFYRIISVSGSTLVVQELYQEAVEGSQQPHGMAENVIPTSELIASHEPIKLRVKASGHISNPSYNYYSKWDGRPRYKSWYN